MITKEYKNLSHFVRKLYTDGYHITNLTIKIKDSLYPVFDPQLIYDSKKKPYISFSRLFIQEALAVEISEDPTGLIILNKNENQEKQLDEKHALNYTVTLQQTGTSFLMTHLTELNSFIISFDIGELKFILLLTKTNVPILADTDMNIKKIREVTLLLELGLLGEINEISFITPLGTNYANFNYVDYYTLLQLDEKNKHTNLNDIGLNLSLANVSLNLKLPKNLSVSIPTSSELDSESEDSNDKNYGFETLFLFLKYKISKTSAITFLINSLSYVNR